VRAVVPAAFRWSAALLLTALAAALAAAFVSHNSADPSFNHATAAAPHNLMGLPGAYAADLLLQGLGKAAWLIIAMAVLTAARLAAGLPLRAGRLAVAVPLPVLLCAAAFGLAWPEAEPVAAGGVFGFAAAALYFGAAAGWVAGWAGDAAPAVPLLVAGCCVLLSVLLLWWAFGPRLAAMMVFRRRGPDHVPIDDMAAARTENHAPAEPQADPPSDRQPALPAKPQALVAPAPVEREPRRTGKGQGPADLPPLSLLKPPPRGGSAPVDQQALDRNARQLETVLGDYGVKGRIVGIAQGPVVTLYELEPAPGIKASRVIGLADDIARSMYATSARVAVIPGRNVIGIELPNERREMVSFSELIGSAMFQSAGATLPVVLGKDIAGHPVIADLAPMPHLLIAGTTGSGKSVGLNAMILSLLYRLGPDQCRMIMIDPKMLELSIYDDIPHLLAPVVTEPQKAIRALRWAVEQMEERYRNMAHINVRSMAGYNERVREALAEGRSFTRKVQTGWDAEGQPQYEEISLPLEPLPLVVVVVDELADLMMTAGKEVEFLIQRLAQKARAAGIHLIMATQRPSVDVITGVIKANLPTRISFQVTSKIDSRTILGEQGAEQLLGKGDMLYMPGGKQLVRVHGPFVSDAEVLAVADYWRTQGRPDYVSDVTEEPDGLADGPGPSSPVPAGPSGGRGGAGGAAAEPDPLQQAIQVVASSRRATISYLQRQLRVGYNTAARLIEQMEEMGLVSKPDHVGRREVLMDEAGNRLP